MNLLHKRILMLTPLLILSLSSYGISRFSRSNSDKVAGSTIAHTIAQDRSPNPYHDLSPGIDISYPQCNMGLQIYKSSFIIIGVSGGKSFKSNPCLAPEFSWATKAKVPISFYMNLNFPTGATAMKGATGPQGNCANQNLNCLAYNYGWNSAADAKAYADSRWTSSKIWWVDVETYNIWDFDSTLNSKVIQGSIDFLSKDGQTPGIYTAPSMWAAIVGNDYDPHVPIWIAGARDELEAKNYCQIKIGSGPTWLAQFGDSGPYDRNFVCQTPH
jgi:hypothetical protein